MLAAFYTRTGPARDVLATGDQPYPHPAAGEVLVRVRASGINPADVKRRAGWRGMMMEHPLVVPHTDGAGEIVEVGEGVARSRISERVWLYNAQGGYGTAGRAFGTAAELVAIPAGQAVRLDDALSFEAGACLGVPAMTAHRAIFSDGPVEEQTILVNGAAGAVGHFAVQLAVAGGARVIGTVGNAAAAAHASTAGAFATIDRKAEDVVARVLELTGGTGVDRIVEVDFGANHKSDIAMLKLNGTIASYSSSSDPEPVLPYYAFANKGANLRFIQGFCIPAEARRSGETMLAELAAAGRLSVAIAGAYALADIASAHEHVERGSIGNVVVTI
ncbi:NADPH:quinone reductase [Mesorhizobium sp. CGMCC 1.15528]|uniref:NADPH:quinone reductase n=1 Tax=Mesorhizobium zhangyense TaxID=1776730 RepID=A0A7C9VC02_9HYPH|nr:NADPH:quinone reductase [Mesorhizobium zhangyense]NGN41492.1 NADPH:quinone reductase [Mesorhizobium zhangyense]